MDTKEPTDGKVIVTSYPKELIATPEYLAEMGAKPQNADPVYVTAAPTNDDLLRQMSENLKTQDNLATQDPLYVVYEKLMITGLEDGYSDFWAWITDDNKDHDEADADMMKVLDQLLENDEPLIIGSRTYRRIGCKYVDKFASAFLTRKAAEDYIVYNSHHLEQPYIFVESLDRNPELAAVRNHFMSKGA